jgi:hypothetical protein
MPKILTMGVYGSDEQQFFQALVDHGVTAFCDIRFRRGMRGSLYSFVNSKKLQERLSALGIRYVHYRELASDPSIRLKQKEEDDRSGNTKRARTVLSQSFVQEYTAQCLTQLNSDEFLTHFDDNDTICLFCLPRS